MAVTINHRKRVENYFIAWKKYDINLLKSIFSPIAKYIIRGKCIYNGIDDIIRYWTRNQKRQKNIRLYWKIINSNSRNEIVEFRAYFFDLEENVYNKINGRIIFEYNNKNEIVRLSEAYRKSINQSRVFVI